MCIKEKGVHGEYAGWVSTNSTKTVYAENSKVNSNLVVCGSGSCLGKGGAWCRLDPNTLVIGGTATSKPISDVFKGMPNYIDSVLCFPPSENRYNYVFKDKYLYRLTSNTVKIDPKRITSIVFEGLPVLQDPRKATNKKLCKEQYKLQSQFNKLGADYSDSSKILSRGYDSLTKIQNTIKRQSQHIFANNKTLTKTGTSIDTTTRQTENNENASYKRNVWLFILKITMVASILSVLILGLGKLINYKYIPRKYLIGTVVLIFVIIIIISTMSFRKLSRGSKNRWGKINWDYYLDKMANLDKKKSDDDDDDDIHHEADLKQRCSKLKHTHQQLDQKIEKYETNGYTQYIGKKVQNSGVEWISDNGKYNGKKLASLHDAKTVCDTLERCDGISKVPNRRDFGVFKLKGPVSAVTKDEPDAHLFIKKSCQHH